MTGKTHDQGGAAPHPDMDELIAKSASTDIQALLSAKENAKRVVLSNPSQANLAALDRATKMLDAAMRAKASLADWKAVLNYVEENGRKLRKTKLYDDIGLGRLKRQPDGTFRLRDVDRYLAGLPMAGTPDSVAEKAADRQRRREEAEIRRIEAAAKRDELRLAKESGTLISREEVYTELAARAVTLAAGIRTAFETRMLDLIHSVSGNPRKAQNMIQEFEGILDAAMNEYADTDDFDVLFVASGSASQAEEDLEDS